MRGPPVQVSAASFGWTRRRRNFWCSNGQRSAQDLVEPQLPSSGCGARFRGLAFAMASKKGSASDGPCLRRGDAAVPGGWTAVPAVQLPK